MSCVKCNKWDSITANLKLEVSLAVYYSLSSAEGFRWAQTLHFCQKCNSRSLADVSFMLHATFSSATVCRNRVNNVLTVLVSTIASCL